MPITRFEAILSRKYLLLTLFLSPAVADAWQEGVKGEGSCVGLSRLPFDMLRANG